MWNLPSEVELLVLEEKQAEQSKARQRPVSTEDTSLGDLSAQLRAAVTSQRP